MTETRKGFKLIKEFPEGENVVSMIEHHDAILIATTKSVYKHIPGTTQFEPMEFWLKEEPALVVPEIFRPQTCSACDYYEDKWNCQHMAETAPPEYYCKKLGRYKMNAYSEPPGDCPLEKT